MAEVSLAVRLSTVKSNQFISWRIVSPVFSAVDFASFLKLMAAKMKEQETEEDLSEAFRVFDKEGQGTPTTRTVHA